MTLPAKCPPATHLGYRPYDTRRRAAYYGPYLFKTKTGRLGMIWASWVYDVYTQGVAYSTSGTPAGPWT